MVRLPAVVCLIPFTVACQQQAPEAVFWDGDDVRPTLEHAWFDDHALPDLSLYAAFESGSERPTAAQRGPFGVGNGRIFAMAGLAEPLNTLHGGLGPTYEQRGRFFGDVSAVLRVNGNPVDFESEWIARPRGTGLVVTRADAGDVSLYTVDAAVVVDDEPIAVIARWLLVHTTTAAEVQVVLSSAQPTDSVAGYAADTIDDRDALLAVVPWDASVHERTVDFGQVAGDAHAVVALIAATDADDLTARVAQLPNPDAALVDTLAWWTDWSSTGVQLSSDDPRIGDLYDGLRVSLRMQQTPAGGVSPLSRYTRVWLRDTIGPVRFFTRAGLFDEARSAIDYVHLCHAVRGDYANSCSSGLERSDLGDIPDWDSLPPLQGRVSAEGPAYIALAAARYTRFSGDRTLVDARWPWIRRGLMAQPMNDDGTQPFSGDETFRFAMGVGLGYPGEYGWETLAWSANTALLTAAASDALVDIAPPGQQTDLDQPGERARMALDAVFWQDGWWAPFVFHTEGSSNDVGEVAPSPYEDVNLKAAWLRVFEPNDTRLLSDLDALAQAAGRGDGTFQTPPEGSVPAGATIDVSEGVATGMTPGYALSALTYVGDPLADGAFDAVHRYAGPSGAFAEGIAYAQGDALQFLYDPAGSIGDTVARYRPWEGGIVGDALLEYLIGAEPIDGGLSLAPHLPAARHRLDARGVRMGDAVVDLSVHRDGRDVTVSVLSVSDDAVVLDLSVPIPSQSARVRTDVPVTREQQAAGQWLARLDRVQLQPGQAVDVVVRLDP